MQPLIHLATRYASQFGLLGAMAAQLAQGLREAGCEVVDGEGRGFGGPCVRVFFNHPASFEGLAAWAADGVARGVGVGLERDGLVQVFVDHPLALDAGVMDRLAGMENFRALMVSSDDAALLRLRWPRMQFARCLHAVWPGAVMGEELAARSQLEDGGRDVDVVVAGGIASEAEVELLWAAVPAALPGALREVVELMMAEPALGFVRACEVCMPGFVRASDAWRLMQVMHRACVAAVNRRRRMAMAEGLRGLRVGGRAARVVVLGSGAWNEVCERREGGVIEYGGEVGYGELPRALARAKVCVALGPTQFATAYSERLLLGLGAGCACVAEDRVMVRAVFGGGVSRFAEGSVEGMRAGVEAMLGDREERARRAVWGVREVAARHLWRHRVEEIVGVGLEARAA